MEIKYEQLMSEYHKQNIEFKERMAHTKKNGTFNNS